MSSKAIILNQTWNYSCIIPVNSYEVKKSLKEAVLVSDNPSCLRAHFAATAYGIKTLALSFFNAFAYFFLGVYHFTKEIFHCSCKEAFKILGSNLADSIKSLCASILGVAVVAVSFFFSRKIYSCFVERKDLPSSTLEKTSSKEVKGTITFNQRTEKKELSLSKEKDLVPKEQSTRQVQKVKPLFSSEISSKEKKSSILNKEEKSQKIEIKGPPKEIKKEEHLTLLHEFAEQAKRDILHSCNPIVDNNDLHLQRLEKEKAKQIPSPSLQNSDHISSLPTALTSHIVSFLDAKSRSCFAQTSKYIALQERERKLLWAFDDSFEWEKIQSPDDIIKLYKDFVKIHTFYFVGKKAIPQEKLALLASAIKKGCFPNLKKIIFGKILDTFSKDQSEIIPLIENCPKLEFFGTYDKPRKLSFKILEALSNHCRSLKYLNLHNFESMTPQQLESVLKKLPNLKDLFITSGFTDEHLALISQHCLQLEKINFIECDALTQKGLSNFFAKKNHLKEIVYAHQRRKLSAALKSLFKNSPFLEKFVFSTDRIEFDDIFKDFSLIPQTIKTLSINSSFSTDIVTDADFEKIPFLPKLRHFSLSYLDGNSRLTNASLLKLAERCPNLRYLSLILPQKNFDESILISDQALIQMISKLPDLEYFALPHMSVSEEVLKAIVQKLPKLRFLGLRGSKNLTQNSLTHLKNCKNLRYLNLGIAEFTDGFTPTQENVKALIPQLKLVHLPGENEYATFPAKYFEKEGLPPFIG